MISKILVPTLAILAVSAYAEGPKKGYAATQEMKDAGKAIEESYRSTPSPVRPVIGQFVSTDGRVIQYAAEGYDSVEAEQRVREAVQSGQCLSEQNKVMRVHSGCVVMGKYREDGVIVIFGTDEAGSNINFDNDVFGVAISDLVLARPARPTVGERIRQFALGSIYNVAVFIDRASFASFQQNAESFAREIEQSGLAADPNQQYLLLTQYGVEGVNHYAQLAAGYTGYLTQRPKEIAAIDKTLKSHTDAGYSIQRIDSLAFLAARREAMAEKILTPYEYAKAAAQLAKYERESLTFAPLFLD